MEIEFQIIVILLADHIQMISWNRIFMTSPFSALNFYKYLLKQPLI